MQRLQNYINSVTADRTKLVSAQHGEDSTALSSDIWVR